MGVSGSAGGGRDVFVSLLRCDIMFFCQCSNIQSCKIHVTQLSTLEALSASLLHPVKWVQVTTTTEPSQLNISRSDGGAELHMEQFDSKKKARDVEEEEEERNK